MRKYRKFSEGGDTNYGEDERPAATGMSAAAELMPEKSKGFKEAFRDARSAGDKSFTWQGKKYTTEMAGSKTAPPSGTPGGAYRGQRSDMASAPAAEIPKASAVSAPASTGEDTSGPSNLDRILMGTGVGAGIAGVAGAAKLAQMRRAKQAAEMSKAAAAKFSQPQARQIATQTGAKKQPAEQVKKESPPPAKDSADTASPRKSRNIFERKKSDTDTAPATPPKRPGPKKPEVSASDKSSKTPRGRSSYRDDADVEFRRGGATKAYKSGGSVKGGGCEQRGLRKCRVM